MLYKQLKYVLSTQIMMENNLYLTDTACYLRAYIKIQKSDLPILIPAEEKVMIFLIEKE
jgi:hypothetical protein